MGVITKALKHFKTTAVHLGKSKFSLSSFPAFINQSSFIWSQRQFAAPYFLFFDTSGVGVHDSQLIQALTDRDKLQELLSLLKPTIF